MLHTDSRVVALEADVSTSADLLATILEGVPHPVWVVAHDGITVFANPASVASLGYENAAQLEGLSSHQTVHFKRLDGSAYPEDECPMLRPRLTGTQARGGDEWFVRRDGSMFPVMWSSAPIELDGGLGAVFAFTDITERKEAERAIRERESAEVRAAEAHAARRRAVENEAVVRHNIARDLHDGAQQRLVVLLVALQLVREEMNHSPERAAELLAEATGQAKLAVDELREVAAGIHPAILANRGLYPAVEGLAGRAVLPVRVTCSLPDRLPAAIEAHAYYFVAEALTNAVKHASASHVDITIGTEDNMLSVEVADDGIGGAHLGSSGSGLVGLVYRVAALDGVFTLTSPAGQGTVVRADLRLAKSPSSVP